jgi:hypothetical protein
MNNNNNKNNNNNNSNTSSNALEWRVLDLLKDQRSLIYKISDAITDNELSTQSKNTYTSDELAHITKQKYLPFYLHFICTWIEV